MTYNVKIRQLHHNAIIPKRATAGSSGMDLHALDVVPVGRVFEPYDDEFSSYSLWPGERVLVRTGIALSMPEGLEAQVRSRSGLALKHGIQAHFGTIDADYRGDVGVILFNLGDSVFTIRRGDRVAQLVFAQVAPVNLTVFQKLDETGRGAAGFGSSGR